MDIGRSISFIFADRSWVSKVLICGLLFFVPIIGWLLIGGYLLRLLHNVITGTEPALPEWNNWGGDIAGGLKAFVVGFVWAIPIFIIQAIGKAIDVSLLTFLITVLSWIWGAVSVSALSDLAVSGNMADAFNLRPFNRVLSNLGPYIIYLLMAIVLGILAMFGLILLVIGVVFTIAIAGFAQTHLAGQAYRISENKSATGAVARF
jgi:hypothetical protein